MSEVPFVEAVAEADQFFFRILKKRGEKGNLNRRRNRKGERRLKLNLLPERAIEQPRV